MFKHLGREMEARGSTDHATLCLHFIQHQRIVGNIYHYSDRCMIFRRRPQHGRPTNINVFNGLR